MKSGGDKSTNKSCESRVGYIKKNKLVVKIVRGPSGVSSSSIRRELEKEAANTIFVLQL